MRATRRLSGCLLLLACLAAAAAAPTADRPDTGARSPIGLWKTIDDKTGRPRALVRVYEQNGLLFARIERSFTPGAEGRVCAVCTDDRRNQPIIGLVIIRNMRYVDGAYSGGDILDPDSGSVYRCTLRLDQTGARLMVRGYIGFPWLGRSQTWERQQ